MPEVLSGAQPGLPIEEVINICADEFGYMVASTRFSNQVKRQFNRALLDIWSDNPGLRRFKVHDAVVTLQAGVEVYDVRQVPDNGGFGWEKCCEVIDIFFGTTRIRRMERIDLEAWRYRQLNYVATGAPEGFVVIDNYRIRIFPSPDQGYVGTGDYFQEVPYVTTGKVDWPSGWDQAALLRCEYYLARTLRPELVSKFDQDSTEAIAKIRRSNEGQQKPRRAIVTRRYGRRIGLPHDNSTDLRSFPW